MCTLALAFCFKEGYNCLIGVSSVRWFALAGGLACGALNYALLAIGCKQVLHGAKRGALLIPGGVSIPLAGLALCAAFSPALLPWFGCACAGMLALLALGHMIYRLMSNV